MIKFIANSFTFRGIFSVRNTSKKIVIFYFIILIFVTSFPLNIAIINNDGWKDLNTVTVAWKQINPSWLPSELPNDCTISRNGLEIAYDDSYYFETIDDENKKTALVINPLENIPENTNEYLSKTIYTEKEIYHIDNDGTITQEAYQKAILLCKSKVIYFGNSDEPIVGDYNKVQKSINFSELKDQNEAEAVSIFLNMIDGCFSEYMVFTNVLINTGTQLLLNVLFVLIISSIFLLVRIKYQKVTTFSQNINIIIASMTIPSLISFIAGITNIIEFTSFTVVLFQLITPLLAIGAIYKGSQIKDPLIKYVA